MSEKPSIPKGTRDFGPAQMAKRQFILDSIKKVFQKYGFQPLETPAMENLTTLTGKYGDEGDQLLFKILDSGEFYEKFLEIARDQTFESKSKFIDGLSQCMRNICSEALMELAGDQARDFNSVRNLIQGEKSNERLLKGLVVSSSDSNLILEFVKKESLLIALDITQYFAERFVNRSNYILPNQQYFQDFASTAISSYTKILDSYLLEKFLISLKSKTLAPEISEKGLRYDLTVPFARYVVMNRHEITFPFKRYQIQPVWRADRPQKGRYREFYQCDADVVGTDSLICEADIVLMIKEVFSSLGILDYTIKINHRAILSGLAELIGTENESSLFVAIDKLDKIGEEKVKEELRSRGFDDKGIDAAFSILNFKGTTTQKLEFLAEKFSISEKGKKGIADFREILNLLKQYGDLQDHVEFDISLARGLSYYTGCIFEVKINNVAIGSVSGGGRYDNLTGVFGLPDVSGVGISFGVDRLYDAMEELKCFPEETQISSKIMIAHFDESTFNYSLGVANQLRKNGIATEVYPDIAKLKKQLEYANKKMIPFVLVIGSEEQKTGLLALKDMKKGEQQQISIMEIIKLMVVS